MEQPLPRGSFSPPESCLLRVPPARSGAAAVHCPAMALTTLDITDGVECMAFLFLCVKLASKNGLLQFLFLEWTLKGPPFLDLGATWPTSSQNSSFLWEREKKEGRILLWFFVLFLFSSCCLSFCWNKGLCQHHRKKPYGLAHHVVSSYGINISSNIQSEGLKLVSLYFFKE